MKGNWIIFSLIFRFCQPFVLTPLGILATNCDRQVPPWLKIHNKCAYWCPGHTMVTPVDKPVFKRFIDVDKHENSGRRTKFWDGNIQLRALNQPIRRKHRPFWCEKRKTEGKNVQNSEIWTLNSILLKKLAQLPNFSLPNSSLVWPLGALFSCLSTVFIYRCDHGVARA